MSTRAHPPATTYEHSFFNGCNFLSVASWAQVIASPPADRDGNDGSRVCDARAGGANEAVNESHEAREISDEASKSDEGKTQGKGDEGCQVQAHEEGSAETVAEATTASEN